jgi:hypothetical protein
MSEENNTALVPSYGESGLPRRYDLTDDAAKAIDEALEMASELTTITDNKSELSFVNTRLWLVDTVGMLERSRKLVKAPFWDRCVMIDSTAKQYSEPLEKEIERLDTEIKRVLGERRREELDKKKRDEEKVAEAMKKAKQLEKKGELVEAENVRKEVQELIVSAAHAVTKTEGLSVGVGWDAEIVDPVLALQSNPSLIKCEIDQREVAKTIKIMEEKYHVTITEHSIPGLKLTPSTSLKRRSEKR